jgi:hypothetical protein
MNKDQERKLRESCTKAKIAATVLSFIAVALIVGSFFVPPMGVVDSSVLAAVGEIFAFAALFAVWEAVDKGIDAKIVHGNTTITLDGDGDGNAPA